MGTSLQTDNSGRPPGATIEPASLGFLTRLTLRIERRRTRRLAVLALAIAVLALSVLGVAGRGAPAGVLESRVGGWVFWSLTVMALIASYTSFEVLFRSPALRSLDMLPISPRRVLAVRLLDLLVRHLPLLLIPAATGLGLLADGRGVAYAAGLLAAFVLLVACLGVGAGIHLATGRSLVTGTSPLKAYLSQGLGPPEAALLFYGPAAVLVVSLALIVLLELGVRAVLLRGDLGFLSGVLFGGLVAAAMGVRHALEVAAADGHRIGAHFREAEILRPWREDGAPPRLFGEGLGDRLPEHARPSYYRHLRQLRRRYRIVPGLILGGIAVTAMAPRLSDFPVVAGILTACLAGVFWLQPAGRALGAELGHPLSARALPFRADAERIALWVLSAIEQVALVPAVFAGVAWTAGVLPGLLAAGVTVTLLAGFNAFVIGMAVARSGRVETPLWAARTSLALAALLLAFAGKL